MTVPDKSPPVPSAMNLQPEGRTYLHCSNGDKAKAPRAGLQSAFIRHLTMSRLMALALRRQPPPRLSERWPACFAKALKA